MMKRKRVFARGALSLIVLSAACQPQPIDIRDYLEGWEYSTSFNVLPSKSVVVLEKRAKIISGENNVLVVVMEQKPIYKPNVDKLSDIQGYRRLILELNPGDTLITPPNQGNSRIYREMLTMSPQYGINDLQLNEKIEIKKQAGSRWNIVADLYDFKFEGEFNFSDSSTLVSKHEQLFEKWE